MAGHQRELASPLRRLGARIIDWIILLVPTIIIFFYVFFYAIDTDSDGSSIAYLLAATVLVTVIGILYEVTLVATRGQTLGKMATGITVIRSDNGQIPGWGKSTGRWALPNLLGFIPYIGVLITIVCYLSLTWGHNHQGWHDKAAGTYVISN